MPRKFAPIDPSIPVLRDGQRLSQQEFHRRYENMPLEYKAELISGVVCEPTAPSYWHSKHDGELGAVFHRYSQSAPGVDFVGHNASLIMTSEDEVQPDLILRVETNRGGKSWISGNYLQGAPELVAEIALSGKERDLHTKKHRYTHAGVMEYIVLCLDPLEFYWFNLPDDRTLTKGKDAVYKSEAFPGLWIDSKALLTIDCAAITNTLKRGLKSKKHKEFVSKLCTVNHFDLFLPAP